MSVEASANLPVLSILGDKVALGPQHRGLLPLYVRWLNDFEVTRTMALGGRPITLEFEESWYNRVSTSERDATFVIYERATLRPIGSTGLHQIDHSDRTAEFGIMIGEKEAWGKGYGTETTRLMLEYGFVALGLHNIMLRAYSYNDRGLRAYQRAGFREFGRRRQAQRLGDQAYDVIYMECLATEFQGTVLTKLLPAASAPR
jgi:RimJ/RimL family protein N-acetyltransferase